MESFNFTLARLKALEPKSRPYTVKDRKNPVLMARVTPKGIVTLQIRRRPKGQTRVTTTAICRLSDGYPMAKIHEEATRIVMLLNDGISPNEQAKAEAVRNEVENRTLQSVYDEYITKLNPHTLKPLATATLRMYEIAMERDLADWAGKPMVIITPVMVMDRFKALTESHGRNAAKKATGLVGSLWNYANLTADTGDGVEVYGTAPLRLLTKMLPSWRKNDKRTRKVRVEDLPQWLAAVRQEGIAGAYLEVLLLTGLRRRELAGLKWETVDLRQRTFTIADTKNGTPLTLPITDRVLEILKWIKRKHPHATCPLPVHDPRVAIRRVTIETGVEFSSHDLRRTFTTLADLSGAGQYVIKAVLNHSAGSDVTNEHYTPYDEYDLREPLQAIESYILGKARAHRDNVLQVVK